MGRRVCSKYGGSMLAVYRQTGCGSPSYPEASISSLRGKHHIVANNPKQICTMYTTL